MTMVSPNRQNRSEKIICTGKPAAESKDREQQTLLPYRSNPSLTIREPDSDSGAYFYQMNSPFMITYEYCSGTDPDDFINIITLAPGSRNLSQETYGSHSDYFRQHPPHFHDYFEFMIVLEGSVTQKIEKEDYRYDAGMCCLITRSLCHFETFNSPTRLLFIGLGTEFLDSIFNNASTAPYPEEKSILSGEIYSFITNDIKRPGKKEYLDFIPTIQNISSKRDLHYWSEEIINALMNPHFGSLDLVKGALCSILDYLSDPDCYHCTRTSLDHSGDFLIFARAEQLIVANQGLISRASLSESLNYSGDYINRIINKYAHMSLSEYCLDCRLKRAAHLLETEDLSVSEISAITGFSNRTYFYRSFESKYGCRPGEYRRDSVSLSSVRDLR